MTPQPRWLTAVLAETATARVRMPWERGLRRQAMIARRKATLTQALPPAPPAALKRSA